MEMKLFIVGGFIRDNILGVKSKDIDLMVVGATFEELEAKGLTKTVGADFPVFLDKFGNEVALARTERKVGVGHTEFETKFDPNVTVEEDLVRRDLTCNSMAQEIEISFLDDQAIHEIGEIIDPFGGQRDLEAGLLRQVSEAFSEDPLRVLRVARFAARLGFLIAPETIKLMGEINASGELRDLTKERVWSELSRAMMERQPQNFFRVLEDVGALKSLFGKEAAFFERSHQRLMIMANSMMNEKQRWMGLFMDINTTSMINTFIQEVKMPSEIAKAIRFSVDLVAVDKNSVEDLVSFMNRWKLHATNLSPLLDAIEVFNEIHTALAGTMEGLTIAVEQAGAIGFSDLTQNEQDNLVGPAISDAINVLRQKPFRRWIVYKQGEVLKGYTELSESPERRLLSASKALADKLDQVSIDIEPMFAEMQLVRNRGPYMGATYNVELDELKAVIMDIQNEAK